MFVMVTSIDSIKQFYLTLNLSKLEGIYDIKAKHDHDENKHGENLENICVHPFFTFFFKILVPIVTETRLGDP